MSRSKVHAVPVDVEDYRELLEALGLPPATRHVLKDARLVAHVDGRAAFVDPEVFKAILGRMPMEPLVQPLAHHTEQLRRDLRRETQPSPHSCKGDL